MFRLPRFHDACLPLLAEIAAHTMLVRGDAPAPRADRPTPAFEVLLAHGLIELGDPDETGARVATATKEGRARLAAE